MPELPEVETIARGLDRRVRGATIVAVWLGEKPEPFRSPPAVIEQALTGCRIAQVHRVGKHIVVDVEPARTPRKPHAAPTQWLVHLGMTGRMLVAASEAAVAPHTHAIVDLADGRQLRFVDPRRFGRLSIVEPPAAQVSAEAPQAFRGTGREPLDISQPDFDALFHGRRTPIKSALLNQKLLHGVGNIYADEGLFRAAIRPRRQAARLSRAELARLRAGLQAVLQEAIALGGSSVSDYVDADGQRGFFQLEHRVYLRTGEPCRVCGTPIRRILVAGRGTHYCPMCQK
jgi:formamidopyrimidine-DNA glycosylase